MRSAKCTVGRGRRRGLGLGAVSEELVRRRVVDAVVGYVEDEMVCGKVGNERVEEG